MFVGVYEIGGRERRDNTLLCVGCADRRWETGLYSQAEQICWDAVEGDCDDCPEG